MASLPDLIRETYARALDAPAAPRTIDDVPLSYDRITPEWLTAVLCRRAPGAAVTDFRLGEASDGSSNRQRIFVDYNPAGQDAGLPPSVFCKGAMKLANRVMLGMNLIIDSEASFFNQIQDRIETLTPPRIHAAADRDRFGYVVVMEDLTEGALFPDESHEISRANAEDMVAQLAALHGAFYGSPELGTASIPYMNYADWWVHQTKVAPDFADRCDVAFGDCEAIIPPRLFARRSEIWPRTMEAGALHHRLPRMLTHCDVHLRNWFILDGRMGLCDWQVTQIGHWSRDFIYAMATALTIEDRRAWLEDLLRLYLDELVARGGEKVGFAEAMKLVRQQLAQALAFWTITYRPARDMPNMQPDATSLCFIERITAAMDDLDALDSYEGPASA
ncbi:hypothetical protein A0J57_04195 [Sphingobium sp. 22B]|uniref:aminoglycoside phosphotransferase family protein n=1 Tax=unclassified Sphingobium TaxID=2611147 RepID=UPI000783B728|nr:MULTISPECIES: aminoglycoside phosphotransferase family protein [unclassified Sphingobium]KXU33846.1 hypothetical protein AXW74_00745 [Sphingobium sp. AM]KYC33790.1 hypothetical protein A0J57_04195 [Sphingobium sp. 22B]OAP33525.1 hypothetical protein A8O16_03415 [Sphingobium sp. 20006FA]